MPNLEALDLPTDFAVLQSQIVYQANSLHGSASKFLAVICQFRDKFEQDGADKFYHGVRAKAKWFLGMEKRSEEYRKEVELKQSAMVLLLGKLTV